LNTKQLEIQAKALAPVIKGFVERAVGAAQGEIVKLLQSAIEALEARLGERIDEVKQAIPAPDEGEKLTTEDVKNLFSSLFAEETATIKADYDAAQNALDEAMRAAVAGNTEEMAAQLNALQSAIDQQLAREFVTPDTVTTLISEQLGALQAENSTETLDSEAIKALISEHIDALKATIPTPQDGKDATQLEILPVVDFEKSYPRGTHALHNGGLLRAYQQTVGEKGWEVVVNGIADVQIEQKDARNFTVRTLQTNGKAQETAFAVPVMVYRNVYKDDATYQQGDTVTWSSSLWHADQDNPPGKPGTKDSGWTLVAKKGRDGKNAGAD